MQLSRIWFLFLFVACSAISTFAQTPVDPTVIINKDDPFPCGMPGEQVCFAGGMTNGQPNPLVEDYNAPNGFIYTGTDPLTSLILEFQHVPIDPAGNTPVFFCQTDIWAECGFSFNASTDTETFTMTQPDGTLPGTSAPCDSNDHHFGSVCPDVMTTGMGATITFTPEPASMLLFGTGLCSILFAAKRRLSVGTEA